MLNYLLHDDCMMFHSYQIRVFCILQGDGDKKIELKPGYMMEHDEDVSIHFRTISKFSIMSSATKYEH